MRIRTNDIELSASVEGNGPWVVMSHSLACNRRMWDPQVATLAGRYRVLRFDTRGHGESSAPEGRYTLEQMADDVKGMLEALGIVSCHWVGLSMGGMIGQVFALRHPGMFRSMVLADTASRYPPEARPVWEARIMTAREQGMEALVEGTLSRWFTEPFRASHRDVTDAIAAMIRSTPVAGYIGCCHAIPKLDLTHRLREITCPALVVVGEQDAGTPVEVAREIHGAMPGSELLIIPSASHLSNVEQPEAFNEALLGFLDRQPR